MKIAIPIPDDVFANAERHARRTLRSRDQLYAEALAEYLTRHAPEEATESMSQVVDDLGGSTDEFAATSARRILGRTEW